MPDLQVDLGGLRELSSTMDTIRGSLDATRSLLEAGADALGAGEIYDSLDSFESNWDDGRGQINKNLEAMSDVLDDAVAAYTQVDEELAASINASTQDAS